MNKNQLKALLRSSWALDKELDTALERIAMAKAKAEKCTAHYGPTSGGWNDGKRLENDVLNIMDSERPMVELASKREEVLCKVMEYIELLPPCPMRVVLYKRYVNYHKFERIAIELNYSWQHVHKLHSKALDVLLQRINSQNAKNPLPKQQSLFPNEED